MNSQLHFHHNCGRCQKFGRIKDAKILENRNNIFLFQLVGGYRKKTKNKRTGSSNSSTISTADIKGIIDRLKMERVRSMTRRNYYSVWKSFNTFFIQLDVKPDNWEDRLTLFIGYLIEYKKVQSQTARSYISAMKTVLMEDGFDISEDKFVLSSLIRACKYRNDCVRNRLPIQKDLLIEILKFTNNYYLDQGQAYLASLFSSLFITAYFGLFRVCELTLTNSRQTVRVTDVHIGRNKEKILFILRSSKTFGKVNRPK